MVNNERHLICYKLLSEVFLDNAYGSIQLNAALSLVKDAKDRAYISNLFYGVLEKNVQLDYILRSLAQKKARPAIEIIIKMGLYQIRYMSTPIYAAINETVEFAKRLGKGGVSGFINALLRKSESFSLPQEGEISQADYLSITFSIPKWIVVKLIDQYGYEFAKEFFSYKVDKRTHIRYNANVTNKDEFEKKLSKFEYTKSKLGYYVTHNTLKSLDRSAFTAQSLSSMIAVNCYVSSEICSPKVLDLCGAPGGKSIYLKEIYPNAEVTCCDVHPHRVELIKKYASRMKSSITPALSDATAIFPEWFAAFDTVICDVPCSGIGVYKNKPDILLSKQPSDIEKIACTQRSILDNAKNYVKVGGALCYSTCTVFKEENDNNIEWFLQNNDNFVLDKITSPLVSNNDGMVRIFPNTYDGADGFFVAKLRRVK